MLIYRYMKHLLLIIILSITNIVQAQDIKEYLINYNIIKTLNIKVKEKIKYKKRIRFGILDMGYVENKFLARKVDSVDNFVGTEDHGVHVLGVYQSLMKSVDVLVAKQDNMKSYIKGLSFLINQNVDIINISASGFSYDENEFLLLKKAEKKGIIVIVSAGNDSDELNSKNKVYPASYKLNNIIVVANYRDKNNISKTSNWGKEYVHLGINGEDILSYCEKGLCRKSGTSQSTPIVSAVVSKIKAIKPDISIQELKYILSINSKKNNWTKYGYLDYNSVIHWLNKNRE